MPFFVEIDKPYDLGSRSDQRGLFKQLQWRIYFGLAFVDPFRGYMISTYLGAWAESTCKNQRGKKVAGSLSAQQHLD